MNHYHRLIIEEREAIRKLRHRGKSRYTKGYLEKRGKIQISNEPKDHPEEANNRESVSCNLSRQKKSIPKIYKDRKEKK